MERLPTVINCIWQSVHDLSNRVGDEMNTARELGFLGHSDCSIVYGCERGGLRFEPSEDAAAVNVQVVNPSLR